MLYIIQPTATAAAAAILQPVRRRHLLRSATDTKIYDLTPQGITASSHTHRKEKKHAMDLQKVREVGARVDGGIGPKEEKGQRKI